MAPVGEDLYMEHPKGFETNDGSILKLIMALYGTKQAGRCWFNHLANILISVACSTKFLLMGYL